MPGIDREKALRPLLHNATTISVQPAPLPVPVSRPLVHELYAQAFALLPTIHTFYGLLTQKAKSLYDYAPEIQPSDYSTEPLDAPAFDNSMLLVIVMTSFTSSTINSLNTFHLSKTLRCLRTSFSLLSLAPLTTSMLDIVSILTSLGATFLRLMTIIPSFLYLSVQTVSGMDPLTGLLFLFIF